MHSARAMHWALLLAALAACTLAQPTEPCTVEVEYVGNQGCVFITEGIASDAACAQVEQEIGNSTGNSATRYSYVAQLQACGVAVPGENCSVLVLAEFLPECPAALSAQVQSMVSAMNVPIEGPLAPAPAQAPAKPDIGCYSDVMSGYVPLCALVATGISSDSACTADGEFGAGLASLAGGDVGLKAFYSPSDQVCLATGLGTCKQYIGVLGIPLPPCASATTESIQAAVDQGLYASSAPALAPAPPARLASIATAPK